MFSFCILSNLIALLLLFKYLVLTPLKFGCLFLLGIFITFLDFSYFDYDLHDYYSLHFTFFVVYDRKILLTI